MVSAGTGGLISVARNCFFQGSVGFTYLFSSAVIGWAFPVVDYISFLCIWNWIFCLHELSLYFARVCLYCSLRPLMYGMTTLAPSVNFPVD